jgi:hypothetical protein
VVCLPQAIDRSTDSAKQPDHGGSIAPQGLGIAVLEAVI